jgi:hypothetical protein
MDMDFASSQTAASMKFGGVVRGAKGLVAAAKAQMLAESAVGGVCGEGEAEVDFAQAAQVQDQGQGHEIGRVTVEKAIEVGRVPAQCRQVLWQSYRTLALRKEEAAQTERGETKVGW